MICCCNAVGTPLYILGGSNLLGTYYATCDKGDMTAESMSAVASGNLSTAREAPGAAANPSTAGYVCGGIKSGGTFVNIGDKTVISTDTTSAVSSANLSYSAEFLAGLSERSSKAYFAGGLNAGFVATADLLTFSSDTNSATASANLSSGREAPSGMNGDSTKGYWAGGIISPGGTSNEVKTADKIVFSTDTTSAQASANLSTARVFMSAGSDGSTKGYWASGDAGGSGSDILDKIVISTDTTSFLAHDTFHNRGGSGSDGNKLMWYGGQDGISSPTSGGTKVTFSSDTMAGAGGTLSIARYYPVGFSGSGL